MAAPVRMLGRGRRGPEGAMRLKTLMCVAVAAAALAGCGRTGESQPADKYAGLDQQILDWRTELRSSDPACSAKADACTAFEVGCKGERPITSAEAGQGMTAKLVVAMSWNAVDPKSGVSSPVAGVKQFEKVGGAWRSHAVGPVNLSTCG